MSEVASLVSRHDWSLHRKGPADQARHQEKAREAIRGNLANIVSREAIITAGGDKVVKVPIQDLDLPRFRYNSINRQHVGQGVGGTKQGDCLGQHRPGQGGPDAGQEAGSDYYEAEITVGELKEMVFADLELPNLQPKQAGDVTNQSVRFDDVRKSGPLSNLDKKRTFLENMRQNALVGHGSVFANVKPEHLRFRTWNPDNKPETNAVVIAMRDVSASMGEFEKYISRSCYLWIVNFLRAKHDNVKMVFITHHTEAKEVDEEAFFKSGESGGTRVSSAYKLALDIVQERYNPRDWNIYPFHFSDGDNWSEDNITIADIAPRLVKASSMMGYGEIGKKSQPSSLLTTLAGLSYHPELRNKLTTAVIEDAQDIHSALKRFFAKEGKQVA